MVNNSSAKVVSSVSAALRAVWWIPLLRGLGLIVLGILVMVRPLNTLTALTVIFGLFLFVDGLMVAAQGWANRAQPGWKLWLAQGVVDVAFGIIVLLWPGLTVVVFFYLLVVWTIAIGALAIIGSAALARNKDLAGPWLLVFGLITALFGVMLLLRGEADLTRALSVVGLLLGVYAFIAGSVQIVAAFSVRAVARDIDLALKGQSPVLDAIVERQETWAAEQAQREAEREAEKAQREREREIEKAQRERERAAEKAAEKARREAEKEVEKAVERAQKEAESAQPTPSADSQDAGNNA